LQGTQLDFAELVFKRIDEWRIKTHDYIDWANELLEGGCNAPSIWELAVYRWDAYIDPDQVERLFQSCIRELGLVLPSDLHSALCAFSSSICEKMLRGEIQPQDCLIEMLEIAEDHNEPYIHWIWIDLARDLDLRENKDKDDIQFNGVLDLENFNDCVRKVAQQFVALCSISLPEKFPWVWRCQKCGAISDESTFTELKTCTCTQCKDIFSMKNMRFFEHRAALVDALAHQR
jgi:hypothetical protein